MPVGELQILTVCEDGNLRALAERVHVQKPDLDLHVINGSDRLVLRQVLQSRPRFLLVDAGRPNVMQLLERIRALQPSGRILVLGEPEDFGFVLEALEHGADGCLAKDCHTELLLRALESVDRGEIWLSRGAVSSVVRGLLQRAEPVRNHATAAPNAELTAREHEILQWVARGLSNKEVARKLDISDLTVKSHLQHIYAKLGIHRRIQVALEPGASQG